MEFVQESKLAARPAEVFRWHARPGAFERLVPPWERVELVRSDGSLEVGSQVEVRAWIGPFPCIWRAEHTEYSANERFVDVQLEGPFASWRHEHEMLAAGPGSCRLRDRVEYALPLGGLGRLVAGPFVRRKLERMFRYRHRTTAADLRRQLDRPEGDRTMIVAVTGATGLVGSTLVPFLTQSGHEVRRLVRRAARAPDEVRWDPAAGTLDAAALEGVDAVVHLAGENIASGRWTAAKMQRIRESRVGGTRLLAEGLAKLERKPRVVVCASAIGFYGDRGAEELTEASAPGTGFLADVCRDWEAAADPLRAAGVRVVHLRIGVVLSARGGALKAMLVPFKLGVAGNMGSGRQYWSWIVPDDIAAGVAHALADAGLEGPVNMVSPNAVTNAEFTKTLGRVLRRPTVLPMPAPAARLVLGKMADDLILASARVVPAKLRESGFEFDYPELEGALRHVLGR